MSVAYQSWVDRSAVEATMGVERDAGGSRCIVDDSPTTRGRVVSAPVDLFGTDGKFVGLGFDGEVFSLDAMQSHVAMMSNEFAERSDLEATPVFGADRRFSGFTIAPSGVK